MRSEFEKYFKENHADSFYSVDAALEMRGDDYIDFHAADLWALWQHQQSKVDELQKRVYELATAFNQLIEMESESISTELDQFDKGWNQSARQTIENIFKLTGLGEQALKG